MKNTKTFTTSVLLTKRTEPWALDWTQLNPRCLFSIQCKMGINARASATLCRDEPVSSPGKAVIQSNLQQAATQKAKVWRSLTCGGRFRVPSKLVSSEWSPHPPPPSQYYCAVLYFRISLLMKSPLFSHSYSDYPNQWQRLEKRLNSLPVTRARKNPEFQQGKQPSPFFLPGPTTSVPIVVSDFVRG